MKRMLVYFACGQRDYAQQPVAAGRNRPGWEFQAVLGGVIARVEAQSQGACAFRNQSLWLSRPDSAHGWAGQPGIEAEVVVIHFRHVPRVLEQMFGNRVYHEAKLSQAGVARIREIAHSVGCSWRKPSPGMLLAADAALSYLSLLIYEDLVGTHAGGALKGAGEVGRALEIYSRRMGEKPSLDAVANEVGISAAHLRRLFHAHMGHGPKEAFAQLRERRIVELLTDTCLSLDRIAEQTGFSEPSAFSRAFKARFGYPPSRFRQGWQ